MRSFDIFTFHLLFLQKSSKIYGNKSCEDKFLRIILASKSPRRRELLAKIIENFEIITADCDETLPDEVHPHNGVEILAIRKGEAVAKTDKDALVISSDTLVELDGAPLGKPKNEDDAKKMLRSLSGRIHNVHTGVAVHYNGKVFSGVDSAAVQFKDMTDKEIDEYVATGEPMDKAGSYGIQGIGGKFVLKYDGSFDTIMGLSVELTKNLIAKSTQNDGF